jgi:quinol monooxygenase YgiN
MPGPVSWNIQLSVQDGRLGDARNLMADMVESTQAERGALAYEWFLDGDGAVVHIRERYADSEAVVVHLTTFGARFAERFLTCFAPTALYVYGDPSSEARDALDGFGAVYLGPFGGFSR